MIRRSFLKALGAGALGLGSSARPAPLAALSTSSAAGQDRAYWLDTMTRMVSPVLTNLAKGQLRARMPVEQRARSDRSKVTHLEAFARTVTGIAPWLELGAGDSAEGRLRKRYIELSQEALSRAVDPKSPDFMNFTEGGQPLVDAAFLAHAVVRAPRTFWEGADPTTRQQMARALASTRSIVPGHSNWLLFSAMVEAALLRMGEWWDPMRVSLVLRTLDDWYLGDGHFGDGPEFHWDYYNSYVIQPFLLDILRTVRDRNERYAAMYERQLKISKRYAEVQERLIAPDGTFPAIGRSIVYRFGAFQLLSQLALMQQLPESLPPPQVRSALTAVIRRVMQAPNTYDSQGWLRIGLYGSQPDLGETYISTGSLYLATAVFLPLGLTAQDPFWAGSPARWTSQKIWGGESLPADRALRL